MGDIIVKISKCDNIELTNIIIEYEYKTSRFYNTKQIQVLL